MKYVHLSRDAELLNRVINDPTVYPLLSLNEHRGEYIDASPLVLDPKNFLFANEFGGFLVIDCGCGVYEIHSQFLPEGRGRRVVLGGVEAMAYMFRETDCQELITACPFENRPAIRLTEAVGMTKTGETTLLGTPCHLYSITKNNWEHKCQFQQ